MTNHRPIQVVSLRELSDEQLARLQAVSPDVQIAVRPASTPADMTAAITPDTEVLYTLEGGFEVAHAPHLRWVQTESAGIDHLIGTPVWNSDIQITSANGVHSSQLPELVMTMILAHIRNLPELLRRQANNEWASDRNTFMPKELRDSTIAILGYGAIGRQVAHLAQAFGMKVLATKRAGRPAHFDGWTLPGTGDPDGSIPERYYTTDELHAMLGAADVVVLALPMTSSNRHLINSAALAAMRPDALLVNIGRGGLVDTDALITALRDGQIGGAALDVTDPEPLPADSPLWQMPNVIITPHIAGMSRQYQDRATMLFAENLRHYLDGKPLYNLVDRTLGY